MVPSAPSQGGAVAGVWGERGEGRGSNLPKTMTSSPTNRLDVTFVKFSTCHTGQGSLSLFEKFCSL